MKRVILMGLVLVASVAQAERNRLLLHGVAPGSTIPLIQYNYRVSWAAQVSPRYVVSGSAITAVNGNYDLLLNPSGGLGDCVWTNVAGYSFTRETSFTNVVVVLGREGPPMTPYRLVGPVGTTNSLVPYYEGPSESNVPVVGTWVVSPTFGGATNQHASITVTRLNPTYYNKEKINLYVYSSMENYYSGTTEAVYPNFGGYVGTIDYHIPVTVSGVTFTFSDQSVNLDRFTLNTAFFPEQGPYSNLRVTELSVVKDASVPLTWANPSLTKDLDNWNPKTEMKIPHRVILGDMASVEKASYVDGVGIVQRTVPLIDKDDYDNLRLRIEFQVPVLDGVYPTDEGSLAVLPLSKRYFSDFVLKFFGVTEADAKFKHTTLMPDRLMYITSSTQSTLDSLVVSNETIVDTERMVLVKAPSSSGDWFVNGSTQVYVGNTSINQQLGPVTTVVIYPDMWSRDNLGGLRYPWMQPGVMEATGDWAIVLDNGWNHLPVDVVIDVTGTNIVGLVNSTLTARWIRPTITWERKER